MNAGQRGGTVFVLTSPSDRRSEDTRRAIRRWNRGRGKQWGEQRKQRQCLKCDDRSRKYLLRTTKAYLPKNWG